jgi:hypothetical protein
MGGFGTQLSLELISLAGGERRPLIVVPDPATDVAPVSPYLSLWSADGRTVYFVGLDPKDPAVGIWRVPAAGRPPRLAVRFDNPTRPWHQNGFRIHGGKFYFTLGDRHSDVWMTELGRPR